MNAILRVPGPEADDVHTPKENDLQALAPRLFPADVLGRQVKVLPANATMTGDMVASSEVSISLEGEYKGKIELQEGTIHIASGCKVTTESVVADYIFVEGWVSGKLHARKGIEFGPKSKTFGSVKYDGDIDIHIGARISAQLTGPEPDAF